MDIFVCCASQSPWYTARNLANAQLIFGEQRMICIFDFCIKPNIFIICYVPVRLFSKIMNYYFMYFHASGVSKNIPRLRDPRGRLRTQHTVILMSKIIGKGHKAESVKGKGPWTKVLGNQGQVSKSSPRGVTQNSFSSIKLWQHMLSTKEAHLATGHIGTLPLAQTKIPDF